MTTKPTVIEALSAAMADVQAVGKGDRNNEQGYSFRGIDAVVNAVGPVFRKHGIVPVPIKCEANYRDVLTSREKRSRECTVNVTYRFYGPAGDFIDAEVPGESMDFGDKGAPKAMSVAYRILLLQTLCIPTHEPEPDAQSYERAAEPEENPKAIELFAAIMDASSEAELRKAYEAVREALAQQQIDERAGAQLNAHVRKRKAELEAPRDSTGNGDRGGAGVEQASAGVGPDREGAGDGGPGLGGEASGGGPGVQPGVHGRGRVDRGAQAPSGNRDAPAAVGGGRG